MSIKIPKALIHVLFTILSVLLWLNGASVYGMDYGIRFLSYSMPASQRTSLSLGESPFPYSSSFRLTFDMSLYENDCYGQVCAITGSDNTAIRLMISAAPNGHYPTLIINDKFYPIEKRISYDQEKIYRIGITLNNTKDLITLSIDSTVYSFRAPLYNISDATVTFGNTDKNASNYAPPMEIRDIRIYSDNRNVAFWELKEHSSDTCRDNTIGLPALASNPKWLLDTHTIWRKIYHMSSSDRIQSTFDPSTSNFYITASDKITVWNAISGDTIEIPVDRDGRVMKVSNYLLHDSVSNTLLSFDLLRGSTSRFDLDGTKRWTEGPDSPSGAAHSNHAFVVDGRKGYAFGGYGFHEFHNSLFEIDLDTDSIKPLQLQPMPEPRVYTAAAIHDGKLYLFGGTGNESGKQEMPIYYFYDLWEYDLESLSGSKILTLPKPFTADFIEASTMYYEERDSVFYFMSTLTGGTLMRINPAKGTNQCVSFPIDSEMHYRDCTFSLFRSNDRNTYYCVMDKIYPDLSHDLTIYAITYPFINIPPRSSLDNIKGQTLSIWQKVMIVAGAALIVAVIIALIIRHKKSQKAKQIITDHTEPSTDTTPHSNANPTTSVPDHKTTIQILGNFMVTDANGDDISTKFTPRLRNLLEILILWSAQGGKGIPQQRLDEDIWNDKHDRSVKSTRNVYIHKLRTLLESVGSIQLIYDKGYYRLLPSDNVSIDYYKSLQELQNAPTVHTDLRLLMPLLPDEHTPWIDTFKAEFSDKAISTLKRMLELATAACHTDDALTYNIAETLSLHDPLSEEALKIKCRIQYRRRKNSLAMKIYEMFCNEYRRSFGEEYHMSFTQIIDGSD